MPYRAPTHRPNPKSTAHDDARGGSTARGYGIDWQRKRLHYLKRHPLCVACAAVGVDEPSTDVDHRIPRRAGGTDDEANLQALCHACHSRKTAWERAFVKDR